MFERARLVRSVRGEDAVAAPHRLTRVAVVVINLWIGGGGSVGEGADIREHRYLHRMQYKLIRSETLILILQQSAIEMTDGRTSAFKDALQNNAH